MATAGGPRIERDGLVFGLDTGYKVADKNTGTRFFKGRPTTNLITDAEDMSGWSSYSNGNDGTFITEFGTVGYKVNNRASWNGLYKDFNVGSTGTYQFSAWFKYLGGTSANNGATVYSSGHGGSDTANSLNKNIVGKWQRVTHQVSVTDVTLRYYLISYGGDQSTDKSSWEVTMPQIELMSAVTPFANGTRSSTQSLIDLTKTVDIDMNTVSFDSTGQPDYDGSNDKLEITNMPHIWDGDVTFESVAAWDDNTRSILLGNYNVGANDVNFEKTTSAQLRFYWNRGERDIFTSSNAVTTDGTYHHVVMIRDTSAGNFRFYVNGELISTSTANAGTNISSTGSTFRVGGDTRDGTTIHNGRIPVVKLYDKVLSAQEIKQNFNAYRKRFDL